MSEETDPNDLEVPSDPWPETKFQLPGHILKNLTPVKPKKKPDAQVHQLRRQKRLEEEAARLRQHLERIQARLRDLEHQHQLFVKVLAARLSDSLASAHERRQRYLMDVRTRARRARLGESTLNWLEKPPLESLVSAEVLSAVSVVERAWRRRSFLQHLNDFRRSRPFDLLFAQLYRQVLRRLRPNSPLLDMLDVVFDHLQLPGSRRMFKFALILIADVVDLTRTHLHSGLNSNTSAPSPVANALSVLVFRCAWSLVCALDELLMGPLAQVDSATSLGRLRLAKHWRRYNFVFACLKQVHLENCITIAEEVLQIIHRQAELLDEPDDDQPTFTWLKRHELFLRTQTPAVADWASIGVSHQHFIESVSATALGIMIPPPLPMRADHDLITRTAKCSPAPTSGFRQIGMGAAMFWIPPDVNVREYRLYWISKLRDKASAEHHGIPGSLRSGRSVPTISDHEATAYEALGVYRIYDKYDFDISLAELATISGDVIGKFLDYLRHTCDSQDEEWQLHAFSRTFHELQEYREVRPEYFRLQLMALKPLLVLVDISLDEVNTILAGPFDVDRIASVYKDLEALLFMWSIDACRFESFTAFKHFENIYKFVSADCFKLELGTNSPQLRFPKFYTFLRQIDPADAFNYSQIVRGAFLLPRLQGCPLLTVRAAFTYYQTLFRNYVALSLTRNISPSNELLDLFEADLTSLAGRARSLLRSCIAVHLVGSQRSLSASDISRIHNTVSGGGAPDAYVQRTFDLMHTPDTSAHTIFRLLANKLGDALLTNNVSHELKPIGRHVRALVHDIDAVSTLIYEVYNPLLNWIHADWAPQ